MLPPSITAALTPATHSPPQTTCTTLSSLAGLASSLFHKAGFYLYITHVELIGKTKQKQEAHNNSTAAPLRQAIH